MASRQGDCLWKSAKVILAIMEVASRHEVNRAAPLKPEDSDASPLAQIGDFYETIGFDALLLCQFAKINPMAPHRGVSRAGVPLVNMPRAVRALNAANLSVVRGGKQA